MTHLPFLRMLYGLPTVSAKARGTHARSSAARGTRKPTGRVERLMHESLGGYYTASRGSRHPEKCQAGLRVFALVACHLSLVAQASSSCPSSMATVFNNSVELQGFGR